MAKHKSEPDQLLDELNMHISVLIVAVVKEIADMKGEFRGEMPCPRCKTGTLRWSIATTNRHARVVCARVVGKNAQGEDVHCVNAME